MKKTTESLCRLADHLIRKRSAILESWKRRAIKDDNLAVVNTLSRKEFLDHVPKILDILNEQIRSNDIDTGSGFGFFQTKIMETHGLSRWQQGFSIAETVRDWNHLRCAILEEIGKAVAEHPDWVEGALARAVNALAELIAEGVNLSISKYEEIRQDEARSHVIDLQLTIHELQQLVDRQANSYREASHDLVGHLGILSSIANLFGRKSDGPELSKLYEPLADGLKRSLNLLEDVKLHSTLESGQSHLSLSHFDASKLIRSTLAPYSVLAKEHGIDFTIEDPEFLEVESDASKLARILQNLLHNAVKFTREGSIAISWKAMPDAAHWYIRIQNSGIIVPSVSTLRVGRQLIDAAESSPSAVPEFASKPYSEHSESAVATLEKAIETHVDQRGEGIGLSIAKRLANLLGGRLEIENSDSGNEIVATVALPFLPPQNQ